MTDLIKYDMTDIWASSGDIVAPDSAKIASGWGVEVVPRQWWNWFENRQDQNIAYILQKGFPEWDITTEYIINKSYVQRNGTVYKAILTSINKDPQTEPTYWVKVFADYSTASNALGSVTPAANTMPYFTSATTATVTSLTAFMRTLLDDGDAATARATLGAQQANSNLTALSSVAANTNLLPYFTSSTAMGTTNITAFGRSLLDDADAAAGRATLGLGTASTSNVTTSAYDTTAGRLLKVGDYGLSNTLVNVTDFNTLAATGFYGWSSTSLNGPSASNGSVIHIARDGNLRPSQMAFEYGTDKVYVRSYNGTAWTAWTELQTTANGASTAEAQAGTNDTKWMSPLKSLQQMKKYGVGSVDMLADATVTDVKPNLGVRPTGVYSYASTAANVPSALAGIVWHFERDDNTVSTAGAIALAVDQNNVMYTATRNNNTNIWSAWVATSTAANSVQKTGDVMSGALRFSGASNSIIMDTTDGADNAVLTIGGGGGSNIDRGAVIQLWGNENAAATKGNADIFGGRGTTSGAVRLITEGSVRLNVTSSGRILVNNVADNGVDTFQVNGSVRSNSYVYGASVISSVFCPTPGVSDASAGLYGGSAGTIGGGHVLAFGVDHATAPGELRLGGAAVASGPSLIRFYTQNAQRAIIFANGNMAIGTGVDSGDRLNIGGSVQASSDIKSDARVTAGNEFTVMSANTLSVKATAAANNVHLYFYNNDGSERALIYAAQASNALIFRSNTTPVMTMTTSGLTIATGNLSVSSGSVTASSQVFSGGGASYLHTNGNVFGSVWGGGGAYLSDFLSTTYVQKSAIRTDYAAAITATNLVGAYALLYNSTGGNVAVGGTASGASLIYSDTSEANGGTVGSGTWRCMGAGTNTNATLWIRIA